MSAQALKAAGNDAFTAGKFDEAIDLFTQALAVEQNHVFYSNRSGAYASKQDWAHALEDADACIAMNPTWGKGYSRKATALIGSGQLEAARAAYEEGIAKDPSNASLKESLTELNTRIASQRRAPPAGANPLAGLFNPAALAANPATAHLARDPAFMAKMADMASNPNAIQKYLGDEQVMQALSALLGAGPMGGSGADEPPMSAPSKGAAASKGAEAAKDGDDSEHEVADYDSDEENEDKNKKPAAAAPKPAAAKPTPAPAAAPTPAPAPAAAAEEEAEVDPELEAEKKERAARRATADALKDEGTALYKTKDFAGARAKYLAAVEADDTNALYYSNLAAVAFEEKNWEEAVSFCDQALTVAASNRIAPAQKARIYLRRGNALGKVNKWPEAIESFKRAILEEHSPATRDALRKAEAAKREYDRTSYLDPVKSEEAKDEGNKLFQAGDYPGAVEKYSDALKRNPDNYKVYANRAACYIKLMDWGKGLDDCDKCLEKDPTFVKAYIRKARIEYFLKRYPQAIDTCKKGLEYDPSCADLIEALQQTHQAIAAANASGDVDEQRREQSMKDPEVQRIMRDPVMNQILMDMQENPERAQQHLKDPKVMQAIEKLAAAGIIRLG